jgi:glucosamine-6-phosphate deaminase
VEVVIRNDESSVASLVADAVDRLARAKPDAVLSVATGDTPIPLYRELARRVAAGELDLSRFRVVMLDEYLGLPAHHDQLYRRYVEHEVIGPLGIDPDRLYGPDSTARGQQIDRAALHYDSLLTRLGVDMQILGIGSDGHIGFNEPMSSLASRTRIKTLTTQTRRDNSRFFDGDLARVPTHVLTQGIGTILDASHVVLLATGPVKASAVAAAVEGPVTARVPASALQLHRHVTVAVDEAAASELEYVDYYRHTYDNKPDWQGL